MRRALLSVTLVFCACPEKGPDTKAQADGLYLAGMQAFMKGNFTEAHSKFGEVRQLNPSDPRLPAAEGEVYLAEVKLDQALLAFEEAQRLDPRRATTWSRLGYIFALKGDREAAANALAKALELNPKDFNALEERGEIEVKDGKLDFAVRDFLAAADLAPDLNRPGLVMRAVDELTKHGRSPEALATLEAQVKRGVKGPELWNELGDRLVQVGRLADARDAYAKAAQANPKDPTLWELVGELDVRLQKPADAEIAFRESLKVKDRGVVHASLARICQARKDDACLREELDKALATASGEELRETYDLADLLASVDRKKDAFLLVKSLADEDEQKGNAELQLRAARLAKDLGDKPAVKTYCDSYREADAGTKCP